jgi:hypothetical protein
MSKLPVIEATLRKAAARRRLEHALHGLWMGLLTGTALWLAVYVSYKVLPISPDLAEWGWIAALAGALIGFMAGGWRRVRLTTAARIVEDRQSLNQRLSTALEVASKPGSGEWSRLVVADAAHAIRQVDPRRILPLGLPRAARWIPALLVLIVGLGFVPEYRSAAHLKARHDAAIIRDAGHKMAELVRRELERREPAQEPVREVLEHSLAAGERLSQVRLTKAQAVTDLADAAKRLREEAERLEAEPLVRRLQEAARAPSGNTAANAALQRQLERLRESIGGSSPEALEELAQQLQKAQQLAEGMQGAAPDAAAQQALSEALNQLAQTAGDLGINLSSVNNAIDSLKNLQVDRVLRDLALAGDDLEKLRDMARKLAEMQQSMAQLGKDLAEQLERGQAEAAAQTLDRMIQQLQSADLSPETLNEITAEVTKALKPAAEYGKVAEFLKNAGERMAAAPNAGATESLAQAAAELRKLAEQARDLQQLAATLQALEGAQLAILNDRYWQYAGMCKGGACAGCASCNGNGIRSGPGGRPGKGVGTWADENGYLYYPEMSERWDNTGINRPDMDPRGHTDRGEGRLSENALPTKLTGQFSPGPMPAITLKGVSIKGQSSVDYEQAVETAQSEAQSALNQDRVPRAYRESVKGYFDEMD